MWSFPKILDNLKTFFFSLLSKSESSLTCPLKKREKEEIIPLARGITITPMKRQGRQPQDTGVNEVANLVTYFVSPNFRNFLRLIKFSLSQSGTLP